MELSTFKRNWMLHYIKPEYLYLPGNENKPNGQLYIPYNGDFSLTGTKKWKKLIVDVQKNNYSIQPVFDRTPQWIKFDTWTAEDENFPYHIDFYYALDVYFSGSMQRTIKQYNSEIYYNSFEEHKFFHPSIKIIILNKEGNQLFSIFSVKNSNWNRTIGDLIGDEVPVNLTNYNVGHYSPCMFGSELCDYIGPQRIPSYYRLPAYKTQYYYTTTALNFTNRDIKLESNTNICFNYSVEAMGNGETSYWTDWQGNTTSFNLNSSYTVQTKIYLLPTGIPAASKIAIFPLSIIGENNIDFYKHIFILKLIKNQIEGEINNI